MQNNPKQNWDGKSKGNKLGYSIFVWLIKVGGISSAYFLLKFVGLYYVWFMPKVTNILFDFYANRLHFNKKEARLLVRKNIYAFGQSIIDKIVVMTQPNHKFTISREGGHYLNELAEQGKGGILVSAHLGNWELAGHLLQRLNTVINIVMYDGEAAQIKQYMDKVTGPKSFNIIYIKDDMSHIYEMSAALSRNELICIHADRYVQGNRTISHSFLGEEALFPLGPFVLASKLKAPVCFVFALKESKYGYKFYGFPPKIYEGRGLAGATAMLNDYVQNLEQKTKEYPEQWFNYYDFWKKA